MRRLHAPHPPPLDEIPFKSLYRKEIYDARTRDGWVLQITRYRPLPQDWEQTILGEPLLLVPGWSQNRHAFTCATFVKRLLLFGADCHIVELRGHGRSSRELQVELCGKERRPLPRDLDWDWDLDSYLLEDIPAAVQAVKERTRRDKVVYLGNSMGGMLGYGYAGNHRDLAGLVTIGAPSDIGRGFLLMRAAALFGPAMLGPLIDALCVAATGLDSARHGAAHALRRLGAGFLQRVADAIAPAGATRRGCASATCPWTPSSASWRASRPPATCAATSWSRGTSARCSIPPGSRPRSSAGCSARVARRSRAGWWNSSRAGSGGTR